jgi:hypothetical protein
VAQPGQHPDVHLREPLGEARQLVGEVLARPTGRGEEQQQLGPLGGQVPQRRLDTGGGSDRDVRDRQAQDGDTAGHTETLLRELAGTGLVELDPS